MSRRSQELTLDTALPWVLSKTPTKCEVDQMNSCRKKSKDRLRLHPFCFSKNTIKMLPLQASKTKSFFS